MVQQKTSPWGWAYTVAIGGWAPSERNNYSSTVFRCYLWHINVTFFYQKYLIGKAKYVWEKIARY